MPLTVKIWNWLRRSCQGGLFSWQQTNLVRLLKGFLLKVKNLKGGQFFYSSEEENFAAA